MLVFPPVERGRWGEETLWDENQWPVSVQVWCGGGGEGGAVCGCGGSGTVASSYGVNAAREWSCNNHIRTCQNVFVNTHLPLVIIKLIIFTVRATSTVCVCA